MAELNSVAASAQKSTWRLRVTMCFSRARLMQEKHVALELEHFNG